MKKTILLCALLCLTHLQAADDQQDKEPKMRQDEDVSLEQKSPQETEHEGGYLDAMFKYFVPTTAISDLAGEAAGKAAKEAAGVTKEHIALADQALENRIAQLDVATNGLVDHMGQQADAFVSEALQEDGPVDAAAKRLLDQASNEFEQKTELIVQQQLRPLGHDLAIDLAQNLTKTALITIKGCFGAVLAYKGLMAYLADQQDNPEHRTKLFGSYEVRTSTLHLCAAAAGAGTFASACVLTYYWFQKSVA